MSFIKFLLDRKIVVGLMVVFIFFIGLFSVTKLDRELFPPISFDMALIQVDAGELATMDVEQQVTEPMEQVLSTVDGVESYESSSYIGQSAITVYIEEGRGDEVFKDIEAQMASLQTQLPAIHQLETFQFSTEQPFDFFMSISNGSMEEMTEFAKNVVKPRLEELSEVREVKFDGLENYEVSIQFNQDTMEELNIDVNQVIPMIQQSNLITSLGTFTEEENEPTIRWDTTYEGIEHIENLLIHTADGIKNLSEIADVSLVRSDGSSAVWKDGSKDFIFTQVGRVSNVTQIEMAEAVRSEVEKIKEEGLVSGFDFEYIVSQADYIEDAIDGVTYNILLGGLLSILTLILFLRNIRATFIIGISIPASILLTFSSMWILGYSFNIISLIALGLGIGMMVDASIVIMESIYRKKEQGLGNREAVLKGIKEVATAVLASMLTTVVVFLPIGLLGGETGKFMMILSVVVIVTLVSSVIVSFTLIPSLSENFLKVRTTQNEKRENRTIRAYGSILSWMTEKKRRRYGVISLFVAIFIGSLFLTTKIPMTIMPDVFNRYSEIMVTLENGVTPAEKEEIVSEMNNRLATITDVKENFVLDHVEYLYVLINMTTGDDVTVEQKEVNEQIFNELRQLEESHPILSVNSALDEGGGGFPVQVEIVGENVDQLSELAEDLKVEINQIDGIVGAKRTLDKQVEEQLIVLNEDQMKEDGVTAIQLFHEIHASQAKQPIGHLSNTDASPIYVETKNSIEKKSDLLALEINTPQGQKPLSDYMELETIMAPTQIDRKDGERVVKVLADISGRDLGSINRDVQALIQQFETAEGYTISISGDLEAQQEAIQEILLILGIAIFLVYVVMAVQFNHLVHPIIVMTIIPMTITGVILGLFITQRELSIMSAMGVIMLIGIVLNNAILLIDRTKQLRFEDKSVHEAVIEAGKNRIRPIFLTTLTTVAGMFPLAVSTGVASNYQAPLATVVITGLLFATLITLLLIPAVYMLFDDVARGVKRVFRRDNKERITELVDRNKETKV
ncbi:efflux RND transporter permease subunit [Halalkalibacter alkaliphilus]|uniref:Efflux RND transporter permease subunit n=1 Tax=Halalkalibacter alkaliphilus TaxID=2917993 RepID=A0A9X1ZUE0_9BACI|nr:efflux RND transporter permease subunit [Halalkalibacter alkaliphilus]MCL7745689.1 efflux RND transporter permease subunit [Halalkalibacter alkaliphilus]